jgi:DNA polymerase-3 subunit epsilon
MKFPWFRRTALAPVAQAYLDATTPRVARKTPLAELTFVVVDAETTGFDPARDRVLSLGALPVRAGRLELSGLQSWLVYQPDVALTASVNVHGILPAQTAAGQPEPEVLDELLPLLSGVVLVGHQHGVALAKLNPAFERHHRLRLRNPTLDTAALAMRAVDAFRKTGYPGQRVPTLDEVCVQCGLVPLERHTAAGDAFTTAQLLLVLCARLQRQLGRPLVAGDLPLERG